MIYFDYDDIKEHKFIKIFRPFVVLILNILFNIKVYREDDIPVNNGYIIASNHVTVFDPFIISVSMKNTVHFMAKSETFKNRFYAFLMKSMNAFPVSRGNRDRKAVMYAKKILENGMTVGIFPEGKLTRKSYLPQETKSGVALVARLTGADVLPVSVYMEKGIFIRKKVTLRFGKIIKNKAFGFGKENKALQLKNASQMIFDKIIEMLEEKHGGNSC